MDPIKTVEEQTAIYLGECLFNPAQTQEIMDKVKAAPGMDTIRWSRPPKESDPHVLRIVQMTVDREALRWIDEYQPDHAMRPLFAATPHAALKKAL